MVKLNKDEFNEHIFTRIYNLISDYQLIRENELIAVALSGGKDSVLTLHALRNYQEYLDFDHLRMKRALHLMTFIMNLKAHAFHVVFLEEIY